MVARCRSRSPLRGTNHWRAALRVGGFGLLGSILVAAACEGAQDDEGSGAGTGTGGRGAGGGGAWTSSTSAAGRGGTAPDAGQGGAAGAGAEPMWEALSGGIVSCTVERIVNPTEVRAFHLEPCAEQPNCEKAALSDWLGNLGTTSYFTTGEAHDTDVGVMLAFNVYMAPDYVVVFARDDGWVVDAYRVHENPPEGHCMAGIPVMSASRYGFDVDQGNEFTMLRLGGVLSALDQSEPPTFYEVTPVPYGVGPQIWSSMGSQRLVWQFYAPRLLSVSSIDGSGLYTMAESSDNGPILEVNYPTGPGDVFYFEVVYLVPPSTVQGVVAQSNGLEPASPYLTPPDGSYYGRPAFAHSHIGWMRGTGQTDANTFASVELWASPYSPNPADLVPAKIDDYPSTHMTWLHGGYGYLAAPSAADAPAYSETAVWRLSDGVKLIFPFPGGRKIDRIVGITPAHVWIVGKQQSGNFADMIVRFALD